MGGRLAQNTASHLLTGREENDHITPQCSLLWASGMVENVSELCLLLKKKNKEETIMYKKKIKYIELLNSLPAAVTMATVRWDSGSKWDQLQFLQTDDPACACSWAHRSDDDHTNPTEAATPPNCRVHIIISNQCWHGTRGELWPSQTWSLLLLVHTRNQKPAPLPCKRTQWKVCAWKLKVFYRDISPSGSRNGCHGNRAIDMSRSRDWIITSPLSVSEPCWLSEPVPSANADFSLTSVEEKLFWFKTNNIPVENRLDFPFFSIFNSRTVCQLILTNPKRFFHQTVILLP